METPMGGQSSAHSGMYWPTPMTAASWWTPMNQTPHTSQHWWTPVAQGSRITLSPGHLSLVPAATHTPMKAGSMPTPVLDQPPWAQMLDTAQWLPMPGWQLWTQDLGLAYADLGLSPFTTDSRTKPTTVNPGSRLAPTVPCTRLVSMYPKTGLPTCWSRNQTCWPKNPSRKPAHVTTRGPTQNLLMAWMVEFCLPNPVWKDWKWCLLPQMHRHYHKATTIMNNEENMTPSKETNKKKSSDWP